MSNLNYVTFVVCNVPGSFLRFFIQPVKKELINFDNRSVEP